jgi:hypothetical protein
MKWFSSSLLLVVLFPLLPFPAARADTGCAKKLHTDKTTLAEVDQTSIWESLKSSKALINQNSIESDAGVCGAACAINILQGAHMIAYGKSIDGAQELFEKLVREKVEPDGGMSMIQIKQEIQNIAKQLFLKHLKVSLIQIDVIQGTTRGVLGSTYASNILLHQLNPEKGKLKMISTVQFTAEDAYGGAHAQIIESAEDAILKLIDPNGPEKEMSAEAKNVANFGKLTTLQYYYTGDNRLSNFNSFMPVGVLTVEFTQ